MKALDVARCRGLPEQHDVQEGEGVMVKQMNVDKGREGVTNPRNFVDVICTWSLVYVSLLVFKHCAFPNFVCLLRLPELFGSQISHVH